MLSYPLSEAEELLESKLKAAQSSLETCEEDLDFLREQITVCSYNRNAKQRVLTVWQTMEVATARVYNWDVAERRKEKAEGKADVETGGEAPPNG